MSVLKLTREILVSNQPKQKFKIFQTAITRWAELADLIKNDPDLDIDNINSMRAVISSTQSTLELPNALIPDGAQKIFLFEGKVKSGVTKNKISVYDNKSYLDLRRLVKEKGLSSGVGSNPSREDLINALEKNAGIKVVKTSKTTKTGKVKEVKTKEYPQNVSDIVASTNNFLAKQPKLEERVATLESMLSKLIQGIYSACSDFVEADKVETKAVESPKVETKIGNVSFSDLQEEAKRLKL
jgi:hypothetical protein